VSLGLGAPLALVLSALVALPILAHLSRQIPKDRHAFGAMLLLERVVKRLRRRRRIKDLLLLLLRVAAVIAMVLAVSGPQLSYPGGTPRYGGSGRVVVVIDRSMSMLLEDGGSTLLQRARTKAADVLREVPAGTLVGVVVFDDEAARLTASLTADVDRAVHQVDAIEPTARGSNLRSALLEARKLLGGEPGEVMVFTDEAGERLVADAAVELARVVESGSAVVPIAVHADPPRNVAVVAATYGDGVEGGQVRLRVANYGPESVEVRCEVVLPDGAEIPVFVDLPPEGEAEERITVPREAAGGVGVARCPDGDLAFDDERYFHLPRVGASRVLVVDGDPGDTPIRSEVYFLERALAPWGGVRTGVRPDVVTPVGLLDLDPEQHRVVFLANVGDPRPFGPRLTEFVRKGGSLVIGMGDNVTADRYNAALGGILPSPLRRTRALSADGEPGVPLQPPTSTEELLDPFRRSGRSGFGKVRANRVMTLEPFEDGADVHTLLTWEGGVPAMVERRIGSGRVVVWTSTFDLGWTNLPFQTVYMPLVQRLVRVLGGEAGGSAIRSDARVGEQVAIPLPDIAIDPIVLGPDGAAVRARVEQSSVVFTPDRAGAYQLGAEGAPALAWIAVNTPPEESDVRRYDSIAAAEAAIAPELFLRRIELAPALLAAALLLLAGSSLLALRRGGA
jgi:hypothetical protein